MRKFGVAVLGLAVAGVLAGGGVALASNASPGITTAETMRLREHDTQQKFVDLNHNNRPDVGDMFVFAGPLTNTSNGKRVGTVQGRCTVMFGDDVSCEATATLSGRGTIEVQTTSGESKDFDVAITGGTGQFQNARGQIHIHQLNDTDSIDTVHLIP